MPIAVTNRVHWNTPNGQASAGLASVTAAALAGSPSLRAGAGSPAAIAAALAATSSGAPGYASAATVGHANHPSWPGSFTGGQFNTEQTISGGTTVNFADFRDRINVGSSPVSSNVTFNGCRFSQSFDGSDTGDNSAVLAVIRAGVNALVTFNYCTFQPSVANYPTPLSGEEVEANTATWVPYGKGYQFAICTDGAFSSSADGGLIVDHCNFWGFGNAMQMQGSTLAKPHIVRDSWFHHSADPFVHHPGGLGQFHNDCWLVSSGSYPGAQALRNTMEIWGNTNCIAWQGSGSFNDAQIIGNLFGGDQQTISLSASGTSQRITFTDNYFSTRIGRSVGSGAPLRSWAVSDSNSGSTWRRNKYIVAGGSTGANYPGAFWGNVAQDGNYWHPGDSDTTIQSGTAHASDYTG